jgi:hypothetical protein
MYRYLVSASWISDAECCGIDNHADFPVKAASVADAVGFIYDLFENVETFGRDHSSAQLAVGDFGVETVYIEHPSNPEDWYELQPKNVGDDGRILRTTEFESF